MPIPTPDSIRYVAKIQNVTEVILIGHADLAFWQAHLQPANLAPCAVQGQAHLQLSATRAKWYGVPFREFTVSIGVGEADANGQPREFYLAHAFNSLPLFAFMERTFFRTPYFPGKIDVQLTPPRLAVTVDGTRAFDATLSNRVEQARMMADDWFGPIHLPDRSSIFYAHLSGQTSVYDFSAADSFAIKPASAAPIFQALIDAHFTPYEWRLRSTAAHAKSQTYRRTP
jgi:hypothetical protein